MTANETLIQSLLDKAVYPHAVEALQLIETHISWVILTGPYAYKIKKPVDFGFLDFSSLERRHQFCEEELRLNKRTAPSIYLEVLPVRGTVENPHWDDKGPILEYAVKMRQFPQAAQLDRLLAGDGLTVEQIDAFACMVANFHALIAVAESTSVYGNAEQVLHPVEENFAQIRERVNPAEYLSVLVELEQWSITQFKQLKPVFAKRKQQGFIRECHGDLHLRNLAWIDNHPVAFDCIEFNPNLRWIDVISDVAFLVMDLQDRQQGVLAQRFLNHYLEIGGDYAGVTLLPFYLVYRALVRAKVDAIRLAQQGMDEPERKKIYAELVDYLSLAQKYTKQAATKLIITRGLSGSGKTTLTNTLPEKLNAIRIRSDVERKRLAGLQATESGSSEPGEGIYTKDFSEKTYRYLLGLAETLIDAGYSVIVDATFLAKSQRDPFRQLSLTKSLAFTILDFSAPTAVLRQRVMQRQGDASDAGLEVLEYQLQHIKPFDETELAYVRTIDTETTSTLDPDDVN